MVASQSASPDLIGTIKHVLKSLNEVIAGLQCACMAAYMQITSFIDMRIGVVCGWDAAAGAVSRCTGPSGAAARCWSGSWKQPCYGVPLQCEHMASSCHVMVADILELQRRFAPQHQASIALVIVQICKCSQNYPSPCTPCTDHRWSASCDLTLCSQHPALTPPAQQYTASSKAAWWISSRLQRPPMRHSRMPPTWYRRCPLLVGCPPKLITALTTSQCSSRIRNSNHGSRPLINCSSSSSSSSSKERLRRQVDNMQQRHSCHRALASAPPHLSRWRCRTPTQLPERSMPPYKASETCKATCHTCPYGHMHSHKQLPAPAATVSRPGSLNWTCA